jgi:hypothetical protein
VAVEKLTATQFPRSAFERSRPPYSGCIAGKPSVIGKVRFARHPEMIARVTLLRRLSRGASCQYALRGAR